MKKINDTRSLMLTYSLSLKNAVIILPLKKIVSAQFAKFFWDSPFKSEELSNIPEDIERKWEVRLANHREKTISVSNTFIEKNKLPSFFKTILKESIFTFYQAYRQMLLWKITYDPKDNRINLLEEGELYAPNYFTVDGEFNDFIWAKRFVIDSNHRINHRFYLGCFYWFENETAALWAELKRSDSAPFRGNLDAILPRMDPLITLRIFQLENQLQALTQDRRYVGNFWEVGLRKAAEKGYEHATYYFWQEIAESKKISIIENNSFFELMSGAIDYPDDKVSYFLYSQLSKGRKENLLDWTLEHNKPEKWLTLLLSPYTQAIRSEIIEFVYQLPIKLYSDLLQSLAYRIKQLKLPFDMEIFQLLWSNLSVEEKNQVLEKKRYLIETLIEAKSFYNLSHIIKVEHL